MTSSSRAKAMKKLLVTSFALCSVFSITSCTSDEIKPLLNKDNDEVGYVNCTKQTLLIKKGIQPMTSFGYKTGEWLTAGEHLREVKKSGNESFEGLLAPMWVSELRVRYCD